MPLGAIDCMLHLFAQVICSLFFDFDHSPRLPIKVEATMAASPQKKLKVGRTFLFSSESVNEGHPDKLCDQVSDAVLDACLTVDPKSKVACETATKDNMVAVMGEITTQAKLDYDKIVRTAMAGIGYDSFVDDLFSVGQEQAGSHCI